VAEAKLTGGTEVEIWNDGTQIRSYLHVKDCVDGLLRLSQHPPTGPVNLGSDIAVSISGLLEIVQMAAGTHLNVVSVEGPRGVAYRNADIDLARQILKWEPSVRLDYGIPQLYRWVEKQVEAKLSDTSNGRI
jgi:nucleoside-diphosphate-sugar epimerase